MHRPRPGARIFWPWPEIRRCLPCQSLVIRTWFKPREPISKKNKNFAHHNLRTEIVRKDYVFLEMEDIPVPAVPVFRSSKPQAVLTKQSVLEIFKLSINKSSEKLNASSVAREYGVNEKTIRDIWKGRTWNEETQPLAINRQPKPRAKIGRPLGRKDSHARGYNKKNLTKNKELSVSQINTSQTSSSKFMVSRSHDQQLPSFALSFICGGDALFDMSPATTCNYSAYEPPSTDSKRKRLASELTVPSLPLPQYYLPSSMTIASSLQSSIPTEQPLQRPFALQCPFTTPKRSLPPLSTMLPPVTALSANTDAMPAAPRLDPRTSPRLLADKATVHPPPGPQAPWWFSASAGGASPLLSRPAAGWLPLAREIPPRDQDAPFAGPGGGLLAGPVLAAALAATQAPRHTPAAYVLGRLRAWPSGGA